VVTKLVLLSVLFLWLLGLMVVPILNHDQPGTAEPREGFLLGASSAYAQESGIVVEEADSILSQELQESSELGHQATDVSPRILVEYADSILSLNLERSPEIIPAPAPPQPTPTPTPTPSPKPEQPTEETEKPGPPAGDTPEPTPIPSSPTPWWSEPQWLISTIIGGLACIAGIIRAVIALKRRSRVS